MKFDGKTILITGAAGTIGRAIAKAFYEEGANLALVDCNEDALKAVCAEEAAGPASPVQVQGLFLHLDGQEEQEVLGGGRRLRQAPHMPGMSFHPLGQGGRREEDLQEMRVHLVLVHEPEQVPPVQDPQVEREPQPVQMQLLRVHLGEEGGQDPQDLSQLQAGQGDIKEREICADRCRGEYRACEKVSDNAGPHAG